MTTSRRSFLRLAAGTAVLPALPRTADAQAYPARPVRVLVAVSPGGTRHCRAADGAMAGEAARPARRHQPSGRRHQYRHRACRALAARRLHLVHGQLEQRGERVALPRYRLQVLGRPHPGVGLDPLAAGHAGEPGRAGRDRVGIHRLCQGRSRSDGHGLRRQGRDRPCRRRAVPDDGRRQIPAHPVSRRGAGDDRPHRRPGATGVRHDRLVAAICQKRKAARAGGDIGHAPIHPDAPPLADVLPGYEASSWSGFVVPKNTPVEIIDKLNRELNLAAADSAIQARFAIWAAHRSRARRRTSPGSSPTMSRSGPR